MLKQQWLTVGSSALIAGTLVSVALPSARPLAVVAASTAGAIGGTLLTRSRATSSSTSADSELSDQQIIGSLARLEQLLTGNQTELIGLKQEINQVKNNIIQSELAPNSAQGDPASIEELETGFEQETEDVSKIIDWLKACDLIVESYKEPQASDALFDSVALSLGQQYPVLKPFHRQIKASINRGGGFSFRLNEKNRDDINRITSFCKLLSDRSFLPCRYLPSQKIISAKPPTNPNMINFFTGDWFESFVYQQVCKFLTENGIAYISLRQIKGTFVNDRNFELDIFFLIDEQPLWIECKAGRDYNEYLTRYTKLRSRMNIPKERAFLVIADLTSEQAIDYTSLWDITVASIDSWMELIGHAVGLENNLEQQPQITREEQAAEIQKIAKNQLLKFFVKKSLNPYPEHRSLIITGLIEVFSNANSLTINQIKDRVSENTQISKSKINDVLRALKRSDCFLDQDGKSISTYTTPISSLLSLDPKVLEQKCIEIYAAVVLAVNPNYFDDARNKMEFQQTTGAEVPDAAVIKHLLEQQVDQQELELISTDGDEPLPPTDGDECSEVQQQP